MSRSFVVYAISFVLFLVFQVLLFKRIVLFNTAFCFIYIAFVLLLPIELSGVTLMLLAFALGLMVDIFYDHQGMHAAASVAVAFLRNAWIGVLTPHGGYEAGAAPSLQFGLIWFLSYSIPLIVVHHLILFFIDAGGFGLIWLTLGKSFASVLFTSVLMLLYQYLFSGRSRL